jgi:Lon protease-like protein
MNDKKEKKSPEAEPKVKLYRLKINVEIEAASIDEARKLAQDEVGLIDKAKIAELVERVARAKYSSRADRLAEAESSLSDAKSVVEELKDEIEQWKDGLPENLQNSDKASQLEECQSALEELFRNLEEAEGNFGSVDFPGMY